ncbi:hypothetical protein PAPYR_13311 [Paratrimastix pyriformis]|uniref:Uncharacterized protein n=1 Tax=Paratrimastix pyriformis TaxID=342808 RepID=A0ABQ8U4L6_9EUKA|nr:hypothetical protein PAPYR_13311 [Paratrimastix pyriformis]
MAVMSIRMNSLSLLHGTARCPDRGAPGGAIPGAPDDLQDDRRRPWLELPTGVLRWNLWLAPVAVVRPRPRGSRRVTSRSRAWGDLWTGPRCWMSSSARAAPTTASWAGGLVREEPSDSTKKTLVPALARALEGSPGDVTLELVIRGLSWSRPGDSRTSSGLLASQAPAERHMTTPPQTPAGSDPVGRAPSRWPPLVLPPPATPGLPAAPLRSPPASSQLGAGGISRYRGPVCFATAVPRFCCSWAAEPLPAAGRMFTLTAP